MDHQPSRTDVADGAPLVAKKLIALVFNDIMPQNIIDTPTNDYSVLKTFKQYSQLQFFFVVVDNCNDITVIHKCPYLWLEVPSLNSTSESVVLDSATASPPDISVEFTGC